MLTILKVNEKKDIYIIGYNVYDFECLYQVGITDDYNSISIFNGDKHSNIETEGAFCIVDKETFDKIKEKTEQDGTAEFDGIEYYYLKDFSGDICLKVISDQEKDVLVTFDPEKMLTEQAEFEEGDYWWGACIVIDGAYETLKL